MAVLRRLGAAVATLLAISIVSFLAVNIRTPHDIAENVLGREAAPAQINAFIHEHDLDGSNVERYTRWLAGFVRGDMGLSLITREPVREAVLPRLGRTLLLALAALVVAIPISLLGAAALARRAGSFVDLLMLVLTVVLGLPEFVLGLAMLLLFAVWLGIFPVDSSAISFGSRDQQLRAYLLPALTLAISICPYLIRIGRAAIKDVITQPYIQATVLRGLPRKIVTWQHVLPNAAPPIINAIALNLAYLIGGVIVIENLFAFPGLGQLLVSAISTGDVFTVQAIAFLMGSIFIGTSMLADLLVLYLNPRLRGA
jgi:peptide/nickel transport system permease protein